MAGTADEGCQEGIGKVKVEGAVANKVGDLAADADKQGLGGFVVNRRNRFGARQKVKIVEIQWGPAVPGWDKGYCSVVEGFADSAIEDDEGPP